jgi:hypothetical protein
MYKNLFTNIFVKPIFFVGMLTMLYAVIMIKVLYLSNNDVNIFFEVYTILTGIFLVSRFMIAYFYRDDHSKKLKDNDYPTVSFVIACIYEEDSI